MYKRGPMAWNVLSRHLVVIMGELTKIGDQIDFIVIWVEHIERNLHDGVPDHDACPCRNCCEEGSEDIRSSLFELGFLDLAEGGVRFREAIRLGFGT